MSDDLEQNIKNPEVFPWAHSEVLHTYVALTEETIRHDGFCVSLQSAMWHCIQCVEVWPQGLNVIAETGMYVRMHLAH